MTGSTRPRGGRATARKQALDVLYAADLRGEDAVEHLAQATEHAEDPTHHYTEVLVRGVAAEREAIDAALTRHAHGWTLERMPPVDRNVLRIGAWEILYADDVPDRVAAAEAAKLVADLSTDDSHPFVGGVLGAVAEAKAQGLLPAPPETVDTAPGEAAPTLTEE